jgi:prepilin-type N-terminal cleavage/methylation domain-containing protein
MKISPRCRISDQSHPVCGVSIVLRARPLQRRGVSLVELLVSVTIMGILMAMAAPSFRRAVDQSRADIAAANLRAIWSAERCYWLENRAYTNDLAQLTTLGLLDPSIVASSSYYVYEIPAADSKSFTATVSRTPGSNWSGQFVIDETGMVTGSVDSAGETSIVPGFQ